MTQTFLSASAMVAPTLSSGAIATTDAANYKFDWSARAVLVSNRTGSDILARANTGADAATPSTEASATTYETIIATGATVDLCRDGLRLIKDVSLYFVAAAPTDAQVEVWALPANAT